MKKRPAYRVAVVGCGKIGALFEAEPKREKPASHAGAVMMNNKTELVALADTDAKNLAAARKLFPSAKVYRSLVECLKSETFDIVIIATPPAAHLALLRECARAKVPMVVCEKPLATSVKEAKQIEALVERSGMTFVLNYQRRFSPLFARVRENIKKGKLGRIQQVTCHYSNGLFNNGGHTVNALAYLLNDEVVSAVALTNSANATHPEGDMNVDALLTTKKGTRVALQSLDQGAYGIHDFHIYGTKGTAVITDYGMTLLETPARPSRFKGVRQLDAARTRYSRVPLSATRDVLAEVLRGGKRSSIKDGVTTLILLDAMVRSAKAGGKKISL
jgi:predicted dehydrogenase